MSNEYFTFPSIDVPLLRWYDAHKRPLPWRKDSDPYRIWVSEIMLQQTRVAAVIPYFERWMQALPDVHALAAADEETLMKLWQGLGYYSRARNLQKAAKLIVTEFGGHFPRTYDQLLTLPGIGEYTAGAIASIAFSQKVSAVDGNLLRIAARLGDIHEDILAPQTKKQIKAALDRIVPQSQSGDFNQALMDLGATVCLPNGKPLCEECPLAALCAGKKNGTAQDLPVRAKKAARRVEEMTVYLLLRDGKAALRKRNSAGLLAGLWEFPHVPGTAQDEDADDALTQWGLRASDWKKKIIAKHIFTHVEWRMTGYLVSVTGTGPADFVWADGKTLDGYAIPGAFKKYYTECIAALEK